MSRRAKQSLIAGALTSSAGVFLAKALGLLYVVPFVYMAGEDYSLYSKAYSLYDILLNLSTAGLPFAVASLVAKYSSRGDYKTTLLVRKMATSILMFSGFFMAMLLIFFSRSYAEAVSAAGTSYETITKFQNVLIILALSVFLVPILGSYRGFYQGLKEMRSYGFSQVLEQFVRVGLLLGVGALFVYILGFDSVWAVYAAIFATGISALFTILYFKSRDRVIYKEIKELARQQESKAEKQDIIIKELFTFGIPFFLVAILGNSMIIVNSTFFENSLNGVSAELAANLNGIIHLKVNKLTSIPQVLAIGFSAGLVPYITESFEKQDKLGLKRGVYDCLNTVLYIAMPLCFCLFALAKPIYYIMYGAIDLSYGTTALAYSSFLAFTGTIAPITSNVMLSLRLRKAVIMVLILSFVVKLVTFFPLMEYTGYTGAITSSVVSGLVVIAVNCWIISTKFKVSFAPVIKNFLKMIIALVAMNGAFVLLSLISPLHFTYNNWLFTFFQLAVYGIVGVITYFLSSISLGFFQSVFKMSPVKVFSKLKRR